MRQWLAPSIGHWTAVTERRMQPHSIIEPFNVVKHGAACGRVAVKDADWQLGLECREEALHRRVVPAVAFTAHTAAHLGLHQERLILGTGILTAPIAMMQQTRWRTPALQRMVKRGKHKSAFE